MMGVIQSYALKAGVGLPFCLQLDDKILVGYAEFASLCKFTSLR